MPSKTFLAFYTYSVMLKLREKKWVEYEWADWMKRMLRIEYAQN